MAELATIVDKPDPNPEDLAKRLDQLTKKVEATKSGQKASEPTGRDYSGLGVAMRLGSEFVAGVIVGAGLGWFVDKALGTTPWGLVVFMLLGFAAGMMNMVRAGRAIDARRLAEETKKR